jgi:hypothetical protein
MDRCSTHRILASLLVTLAGCRPTADAKHQQQQGVPVAHAVDSTATRAAPDSIRTATAPPRSVNDTLVHPMAVPAPVGAACESASSMMREALGLAVRREDGAYQDSFRHTARVGCRLSANATAQTAGIAKDPVGTLQQTFARRGWRFDQRYGADGPDGSLIGMRYRDIMCLVNGQWDGGDDSEPDSVSAARAPDPSYAVQIECARDVASNAEGYVADSLWSIARQAGLDSIYAISYVITGSPFELGDFDGDGVVDAAVLIEHRTTGKMGVAVVRRGARQVTILGAGAGGSGPDDLEWVREVEVFHRGTTWDLTIGDRPATPLLGDALWVAHRDSVSAFYVWNGTGFAFEAHRVSGRPR